MTGGEGFFRYNVIGFFLIFSFFIFGKKGKTKQQANGKECGSSHGYDHLLFGSYKYRLLGYELPNSAHSHLWFNFFTVFLHYFKALL